MNVFTRLSMLLVVAACGAHTTKPFKSVEESTSRLSKYSLPVQVDPEFTIGSGVLIKLAESGVTGLLTNEHVCKAAVDLGMPIHSESVRGRTSQLIPVKRDTDRDLCLLIGIDVLGLPSLSVKIDSFSRGQELLVLGYPLNGPLTPQVGFYLTERIQYIGAPVEDPFKCPSGKVMYTFSGFICLSSQLLNSMTTTIFSGNSGSPVFNADESLVGLVNSADSYTHQGFFISGRVISEFLKGL